jgi:hypothetical protein
MNDGRGDQLINILISSASVPEDLIGVGEQEPNRVRRHGNQNDRKDKTRANSSKSESEGILLRSEC